MIKKLKMKNELIIAEARKTAILSIALLVVFIISFVFSMIYMFL